MPIGLAGTVGVRRKNPLLLRADMTARSARLDTMIGQARLAAARTATDATRAGFTYKRRVKVPDRPGRTSTQGRFKDYLTWQPQPGGVGFDTKRADSEVPYWIIQEIGTGQSARLKRGGEAAGPGQKAVRGRPKKGTTYVKTIKSQIGRAISPSLVWATGPRGAYIPPGGQSANQQLFLRSKFNTKAGLKPKVEMAIGKEIDGQDFVQKGADAGYGEYKKTVLAAARLAFAGHRYRP